MSEQSPTPSATTRPDLVLIVDAAGRVSSADVAKNQVRFVEIERPRSDVREELINRTGLDSHPDSPLSELIERLIERHGVTW